jgi:cysteinyl-tRNA synthetase
MWKSAPSDTLGVMLFRFFKKKAVTSMKHPPLSFFNTASNTSEIFTPLKPGAASIYTCGPTVYDHVHIGNLRSFVFADLIKRVLMYNGYTVKHTLNFTDFGHLSSDGDDGEDKMMRALKREGKPITLAAMHDLAQVFIASFKHDADLLRILPPTTYAPASAYVREQIQLIQTLYEKGYAYETSDGVYFDITKFPRYGVLGNIDVASLKEGARVEVNPEKRHPADFALWKKGLLGWDSAWGKGFPGWHIECTAMCFSTLGKQIDIHTGGEDLKYTHHNGEIAQAEAVTGKQYVRYWLHSAHLKINDTKISKSLGNGIRLQSLIDQGFSPLVYRYWLMTSHYRAPANFTFEALESSKQALFRLKRYMYTTPTSEPGSVLETYRSRFNAAINDDLDTPRAIALMWELMKDDQVSDTDKIATLRNFDAVLAIGLTDAPSDVRRELGIVKDDDTPAEIRALLEARKAAREARNWAEADRIREALNVHGYIVEDTKDGQRITKEGANPG